MLAAACSGVITGLGVEGYRLAIDFLARQIAAGKPAAR
jgi:3-dehydroquinate dehydratase